LASNYPGVYLLMDSPRSGRQSALTIIDSSKAGKTAMSDTNQPVMLDGISRIAERFDGFLVDLWGCVHNGIEPYPEAVDALLRLSDMGKKINLLSNGPRRAADLIARLDEMGVPRKAYHYVMSSGEAAWQAFADRNDDFHAALGTRCYHLGPSRDVSVFTGNGLTAVSSLADADFILNTGPLEFSDTLADYEGLLAAAREAGLPMVCANPDLVVHVGDDLVICAGLIAQRYEEIGGAVAYHGKPHPSVYDRCYGFLAGIGRDRILAIGDGLRTDIQGAYNQGIASLFLTQGIHIDELGDLSQGEEPIRQLASRIAAIPSYALPRLRW
jgi:HAD superfamily hydrolase (TIGR01459 family)